MEKKTKACPFCGEEILEEAKKCKHCGEFLEEIQKKEKKTKGCLYWLCIIIVICFFVGMFSDRKINKSNVRVNEVNHAEHYTNLDDAYKDHKNYIRNVCKEGLKLISTNQEHNFEGPTYAGEYQGKFILKGTDNGVLFMCEFIPAENEWGMNLEDVKRDI